MNHFQTYKKYIYERQRDTQFIVKFQKSMQRASTTIQKRKFLSGFSRNPRIKFIASNRQIFYYQVYKLEVAKETFMKSSNRDEGWLTGRLYFNREDKRVIIKKPRSGFGYTMNLGNKWTWIFNIIFVIIIVILVSVL